MPTTLKEAISNVFTVKSWKSKRPGGTLTGKRAERGAETKGFEGLTVRLVDASWTPATPAERLMLEILKHEGRTSLARLVERAARELYSDEVRNGASALDIGLYGPGLFVSDVISELESGNGIRWEIERPREKVEGILPDLS